MDEKRGHTTREAAQMLETYRDGGGVSHLKRGAEYVGGCKGTTRLFQLLE